MLTRPHIKQVVDPLIVSVVHTGHEEIPLNPSDLQHSFIWICENRLARSKMMLHIDIKPFQYLFLCITLVGGQTDTTRHSTTCTDKLIFNIKILSHYNNRQMNN